MKSAGVARNSRMFSEVGKGFPHLSEVGKGFPHLSEVGKGFSS
jgi:hypothetical protein